ncbi:MAG TPA: hypothetical protein VLV83_01775 [Acidobacteriota bacterium]|nr:hypothetical protein [Acidobacteriota bacterium]
MVCGSAQTAVRRSALAVQKPDGGGGAGRGWNVELFDGGPWPDWLPWGYGFPCGLARESLHRLLPGGRPARVLDGYGASGAAAAQALLLGHEVWVCERHSLGMLAARARARALEMDPERLEELRLAFLEFGARLSVRPAARARRGLWPSQLRRQALAVAEFILRWQEDDLEAADLLRMALAAALSEAAERPQLLRKIRPSLRARRRQSGLIGLLAVRLGRMVEDLRRLRPQVVERPPVTAFFFNEGFPAPQLPEEAFDLILLGFGPWIESGRGDLESSARRAGLAPARRLAGGPRAECFKGALDLPLLDASLLAPESEMSARLAAPGATGDSLLGSLSRYLKPGGRAALWMPPQAGGPEAQANPGSEALRRVAQAAGLVDEDPAFPGLILANPG